jgi:hypothetical protein
MTAFMTFDHLMEARKPDHDGVPPDRKSNQNWSMRMKLDSELVERTLGQIEAEAIPEDHPVIPKLKDLFGDHTFFLDISGLNIIEPMEEKPRIGKLVNVASWDDTDPPHLLVHVPESTDVLIEFGPMH